MSAACLIHPRLRLSSAMPRTGAKCQRRHLRGSKPQCYSITSSARAKSVGGTSMPSALAVRRLIKNSNFVGPSPELNSASLLSVSCRHREPRADTPPPGPFRHHVSVLLPRHHLHAGRPRRDEPQALRGASDPVHTRSDHLPLPSPCKRTWPAAGTVPRDQQPVLGYCRSMGLRKSAGRLLSACGLLDPLCDLVGGSRLEYLKKVL